jgi:hypothetical protein
VLDGHEVPRAALAVAEHHAVERGGRSWRPRHHDLLELLELARRGLHEAHVVDLRERRGYGLFGAGGRRLGVDGGDGKQAETCNGKKVETMHYSS